MLKKLVPLAALGLAAFVCPPADRPSPHPLGPDREIASLFPERTVAYVEGSDLTPLFEQGLDHPFVRNLLGSELGRILLAKAARDPHAVLATVDERAGRALLPALARLSSRGIALGTTIDDGAPRSVLVLLGHDPDLLADLLDRAFDLLEERFHVPGAFDRPQRIVHGADVWSLGEEVVVARRDELLVAGNDERLVRDVLERAADPDARGLLDRPDFRAHARSLAGSETAWAWVDLHGIEAAGDEDGGIADLRALNRDPGAQSLLGPGVCALGTASTVSAWLAIGGSQLTVGLRGLGLEPAEALLPSASPPPALAFDDEVGRAVLYRDFAALFRERVALFPPEELPGFSKAIAGLGLFFGGKDVGEEVLPGLSPWIRVVSRPLAYEEGREPEIPLPGVAIVARLHQPDVSGPEIVAAFQSLIGVVGLDQAQKSGHPLRLRLASEGDTEISWAQFLAPGPEDGVDLRYNLEPACAIAGDQLVLGTHVDLVRAVIRRLGSGEAREPRAGDGVMRETLRLHGPPLARAIEQNLEALVTNKVLEDGVTYETAEEEIGGLRLLLAMVEGIDVVVEYPEAAALSLTAEIQLAHPSLEREE